MKLLEFLKMADEAAIKSAPTTRGNLLQIAYGHGKCSSSLARSIALWTDWAVTPHEISPKHFVYPNDGLPPDVLISESEVA